MQLQFLRSNYISELLIVVLWAPEFVMEFVLKRVYKKNKHEVWLSVNTDLNSDSSTKKADRGRIRSGQYRSTVSERASSVGTDIGPNSLKEKESEKKLWNENLKMNKIKDKLCSFGQSRLRNKLNSDLLWHRRLITEYNINMADCLY